MTRRIFVTSDTHFGHEAIIGYCGRPFANAEIMNECIADYWNEAVRPDDIVYHLGDVYFGAGSSVLPSLNGRKRLVLGNHDNAKDPLLTSAFQKIMVWRMFPEYRLLLSHVPLHESVLANSYGLAFKNVHGHIHQQPAPTCRHLNVSVEQTDYKPIELESLA